MYLKFKVGTYYIGPGPKKQGFPQMSPYKCNIRSSGYIYIYTHIHMLYVHTCSKYILPSNNPWKCWPKQQIAAPPRQSGRFGRTGLRHREWPLERATEKNHRRISPISSSLSFFMDSSLGLKMFIFWGALSHGILDWDLIWDLISSHIFWISVG